jgi:hypothetical protein
MLRPSPEDPNLIDREAQPLGKERRDRILLTLADSITGPVRDLHHFGVLLHLPMFHSACAMFAAALVSQNSKKRCYRRLWSRAWIGWSIALPCLKP